MHYKQLSPGSAWHCCSRKGLLAIAAVIDVALNGKGRPVRRKTLALRHNLPARHLEPVLQALVREGILKGIRGPRGGYELARERKPHHRRRDPARRRQRGRPDPDARLGLLNQVVKPAVAQAEKAFAAALGRINIEDLARRAEPLMQISGVAARNRQRAWCGRAICGQRHSESSIRGRSRSGLLRRDSRLRVKSNNSQALGARRACAGAIGHAGDNPGDGREVALSSAARRIHRDLPTAAVDRRRASLRPARTRWDADSAVRRAHSRRSTAMKSSRSR